MSIVKANGLGTTRANTEKDIRESILDKFSNVGREVCPTSGKVLKEGVDWLAGLDGHTKMNIAMLYENQAKVIQEATTSDSSGSFETIAFPMIRRIYSRLLANDIVSVQAMSYPSGDIYFFNPQISDRIETEDQNGDPAEGHTSPHAKNLAECVGANCPDTTYSSNRSLYDRFYNDKLYDHSRGKFTIVTATGTPVRVNTQGEIVQSGDVFPVANDGTIRNVLFAVTGFDGNNDGTSRGHTARLNGSVGLEIDVEDFLSTFEVINLGDPILSPNGDVIVPTGGIVEYRFLAQKYGKSLVEYVNFCQANGNLYVEIDLFTPNTDCEACPSSDGFIGADATGTTFSPTGLAFVWKRYDDLEYSSEMGEVTFTLDKVYIAVKDRKLRARWSPEASKDAKAYHNIDVESELTAIMAEQIAMEIDREILRSLKRGAAWKLNWDYNGWKAVGSQKYTEKEWKQTLITKINQVSAQIHKSTLRGGANFVVISTEVSALFDDLENFMVSNNNIDDDKYNLGMRRAGTLSGRYTVYVDPYSRASDVLIGHKGNSILDTGFIYAPYMPLELTEVMRDFNNFTSVRGIMTRYATKMVNNRYYGLVRVINIPTFNDNELR